MKKIIIFLFSLFIFQLSYAVDFNSTDSRRYILNDGEKYLNFTIKQTTDREITKENGINLIILDDYKFRFNAKVPSTLNIFGSAKDKIDNITISPDLLSINIFLKNDFVKGDDLILENLGIIIYDRAQGKRSIGIDINNDKIIDYYDSNSIEIVDTDERRDFLAPNEVFSLTGTLNNSGVINISWINPGDIDLNGNNIIVNDKNGQVLKDEFIYANSYSLYFSDNIKNIIVKSGDKRGNMSHGIEINLDNFSTTGNLSLNNTGTVINTSTGELIVKTEKIEDEILDKEEIIIDKTIPNFKTKTLADFMIKFDKKLDKREYKKEVRIVRNEIIKLLKDYEDRKIDLKFLKSELIRLIEIFTKIW